MTAQAAQANDKSSNWEESTIKVRMGTKQFCSRRYKFECFMDKIDLHCCCVFFLAVCQLLGSILSDFDEFFLYENFKHVYFIIET